ncbi:MAG TPA: type 1 glutamine amidotransferase [Patescibacteria group bacterium]|nr:type 1 glutamine amidotransferase [Patescibacteria group bacterium]
MDAHYIQQNNARILLLQSTVPEFRDKQYQFFVKGVQLPPAQLIAFDAIAQKPTVALTEQVDGVIISGSPYRVSQHEHTHLDALAEIVRHCVQKRILLLGICYGAHVMAYALGGTVEYAPNRREIGTRDIHVLPTAEGDPLFGNLPYTFRANCFHTDDIVKLPENAVPLACSDTIQFHAFKIAGAPAYAMQFHPEYDKPSMTQVMRMAYTHGSYFTNEADYKQHQQQIFETPFAASLLQKFVTEVVQLQTISTKLEVHS